MNHQPDKLFREKFENFQRPVSANAWSRVEARLEKKNNKGLLLKIAASLIFVAVSGVMIWQWNFVNDDSKFLSEGYKKAQKQTTASGNDPDSNREEKKSTTPVIVTPQEEKKEVAAEKKVTETKKSTPKKSLQQPVVTDVTIAKVENEIPSQINELEKVNEAITENAVTENPVIETPVVVAEVAEPKKEDSGVTLIYSAEEVNEKYLDKKALADATSGEKKPSTLRKLWDKASDLKNNQEAFGDLRQKKNEILALNFIGEKRSKN